MNTKTVKEKVEDIIYKGIPFVCSEEIYHEVADKIDKLYRKEMENKIQNLFDSIQFILVEEAVKTRVFDRILRQFVSVRDNKNKVKVLKKMPKAKISYTCCNIEVSEPKGTEVLCPECKEWVTTK